MGLFRKNTGEISIKFYGNPEDTLSEDEVSVVYNTKVGDSENIAADFWKYAGKVMYNLGADPAAHMLRTTLFEKITNGLRKGDDILHGPNYSLNKVTERSGHVKACKATFYEKDQPKTTFSWGGESYYAPMSVLAFLQYLVDNLAEDQLNEITELLQGFLEMTITGDLAK